MSYRGRRASVRDDDVLGDGDRRACGHFPIVADEAAGLEGVVGRQVFGPAVGDRLEAEPGRDLERSVGAARRRPSSGRCRRRGRSRRRSGPRPGPPRVRPAAAASKPSGRSRLSLAHASADAKPVVTRPAPSVITGLVDLHLVRRPDIGVVGLVGGAVLVVVVSGDAAVGGQGAGLEDGSSVGAGHDDVEPRPPRTGSPWGNLCPAWLRTSTSKANPAALPWVGLHFGIGHGHACGGASQMVLGAKGRQLHLGGKRGPSPARPGSGPASSA